jgi:hypothetical protein
MQENKEPLFFYYIGYNVINKQEYSVDVIDDVTFTDDGKEMVTFRESGTQNAVLASQNYRLEKYIDEAEDIKNGKEPEHINNGGLSMNQLLNSPANFYDVDTFKRAQKRAASEGSQNQNEDTPAVDYSEFIKKPPSNNGQSYENSPPHQKSYSNAYSGNPAIQLVQENEDYDSLELKLNLKVNVPNRELVQVLNKSYKKHRHDMLNYIVESIKEEYEEEFERAIRKKLSEYYDIEKMKELPSPKTEDEKSELLEQAVKKKESNHKKRK